MSEEMKNLNEQPEETPVEHVEPQAEAKKPLDKKTLGIIIGAAAAVVVVLAIVLIALLGGNKNPGPQGPVLNDYTLGMGVVVGFDDCATGLAQVDATVATVVLDKDGKIVLCRIDAVQNKATLNTDGTFVLPEVYKTKMEKGDAYGMAAALGYGMDWNGDGVVKEWYEQAKAFEKHVIGMTAAQVEAMATKEVPGKGYIISADDALLSAGCTIQITDFKAAVVKACNDEFKVSFKSEGNFTLGVAANSYDDESTTATADKNGSIHMYSDFAASVVEDGKIVASLNDAIQPNVNFNLAGEIVGTSFKNTKRALKSEYGMAAALNYGMDWNGDGKVLEWYEQSAAFSAHVVGMTGAEVEAMGTKEVPGKGYVISNDDALLSAGCTIQITSIKAVVAESVANAR